MACSESTDWLPLVIYLAVYAMDIVGDSCIDSSHGVRDLLGLDE